jgi:hypothetical protein
MKKSIPMMKKQTKMMEMTNNKRISRFLGILISLAILLLSSCSHSTAEVDLAFSVNGQKVDLLHGNYLGKPREEFLLTIEERVLNLEITQGFERYEGQLYWDIDGKMAKVLNKGKILLADQFEESKISTIGLCLGKKEGPCVRLNVIRQEGEGEPSDSGNRIVKQEEAQNKSIQELSQETAASEIGSLVKLEDKLKDNQKTKQQKNILEEETRTKEVEISSSPSDLEEDLLQELEDTEFSRSAKTGFVLSRRCPEEKRKWVDGIAIVELRPQVNLSLSSLKVLGAETGKVSLEISSSGKVIHRLTERQILAGVPSEINFQHLNLVLIKGKIYEITLRPSGSDLLFEDYLACHSEVKSSAQMGLKPKKNGGIFFDISYLW